jgi:hypothetical protein
MKKGWKTSEFWVAVIGGLLPILKEHILPSLPSEIIYPLIAYILGRCFVKGMRPNDLGSI